MRLEKNGKLSSKFIGLFEILEKVRVIAYILALPLELTNVYNVFHMSILRKYQQDLTHVFWYDPLPI